MDYRIAQTKHQKFLALIKSFPAEIVNDADNHDVADFWGECLDHKRLEPLLALRPAGKKDLYGLCTPTKEGSDTFDYGIGILVDDDTLPFNAAQMESLGYRSWEVKPGTYAVFDCLGNDGSCISETWTKFYREFLPQTGYEAAEETDYELYPQQETPGIFCQLWIPVKRK